MVKTEPVQQIDDHMHTGVQYLHCIHTSFLLSSLQHMYAYSELVSTDSRNGAT